MMCKKCPECSEKGITIWSLILSSWFYTAKCKKCNSEVRFNYIYSTIYTFISYPFFVIVLLLALMIRSWWPIPVFLLVWGFIAVMLPLKVKGNKKGN